MSGLSWLLLATLCITAHAASIKRSEMANLVQILKEFDSLLKQVPPPPGSPPEDSLPSANDDSGDDDSKPPPPPPTGFQKKVGGPPDSSSPDDVSGVSDGTPPIGFAALKKVGADDVSKPDDVSGASDGDAPPPIGFAALEKAGDVSLPSKPDDASGGPPPIGFAAFKQASGSKPDDSGASNGLPPNGPPAPNMASLLKRENLLHAGRNFYKTLKKSGFLKKVGGSPDSDEDVSGVSDGPPPIGFAALEKVGGDVSLPSKPDDASDGPPPIGFAAFKQASSKPDDDSKPDASDGDTPPPNGPPPPNMASLLKRENLLQARRNFYKTLKKSQSAKRSEVGSPGSFLYKGRG